MAIIPQLIMLQQAREVENLTSNFVFAMGAYRSPATLVSSVVFRAFYILNWVYRYFGEGYVNYVGWFGGLLQTGLYLDFFYYYAISKWYGQKLILPMNE